jgi:hypothetical protein
MFLQIGCDSRKERFVSEVIAQHADDRTSFEIADVVENLVNLKGVLDRDLNRMRGP